MVSPKPNGNPLGKPVSLGSPILVGVVGGSGARAVPPPVGRLGRAVGGEVAGVVGAGGLLLLLQLRAWRAFARVHVHPAAALLADDETAPVELALALVHLAHRLRVVATPTAHDVTAVRVQGCLVARASCCAQRS